MRQRICQKRVSVALPGLELRSRQVRLALQLAEQRPKPSFSPTSVPTCGSSSRAVRRASSQAPWRPSVSSMKIERRALAGVDEFERFVDPALLVESGAQG